MASIELHSASKHFGSVVAVDGVSLEVRDGEFMVLVGPSGCGKTTVLRLIAGLTELSSGRVCFDGRDMSGEPPGARSVAMVFQNYALFPHLTVERNLSFGMRLRRVPSAERAQRVAEVARLLRIEGLLSRYPRELSGGQKQRVALGRALIRRPVAFLLDEPLSNLDPALRVEMRAEIAALHSRYPITTVYVTHDQVEAMTMGDRLAVINEGRITQVGTPLELYNDPRDVFTAGFIGSPAMNLVEMSAHVAGRELVLAGGEELRLTLPLPIAFQETAVAAPAAMLPERVVAGVRPEHLRLCAEGTPGAIAATVTLVEQLGREHIVYLSRGELKLRSVVPAGEGGAAAQRLPGIGALVHVAPDTARVLLFDAASGKRIGGTLQ